MLTCTTDDRGSVLGILKGFLGLSTSLYASIFWAAFSSWSSLAPPGPPAANSLGATAAPAVATRHATELDLNDGWRLHSASAPSAADAAGPWAQPVTPGAGHGSMVLAGLGDITQDGAAAAQAWSGVPLRLLQAAVAHVVGASGSTTAGCVAFLLFLAIVPSTLNLIGSIFINQVRHTVTWLHTWKQADPAGLYARAAAGSDANSRRVVHGSAVACCR